MLKILFWDNFKTYKLQNYFKITVYSQQILDNILSILLIRGPVFSNVQYTSKYQTFEADLK